MCVEQVYFYDAEKTGETDFVQKPKSIYYYGIPFVGKSGCTQKVHE